MTAPSLLDRVRAALKLVERGCQIIETGDDRLLASDGPAGGLPPDISLHEWRELYVAIDKARALLAELSASEASDAHEDTTCTWKLDEDEGAWRTACGLYWCFNDGGSPAENNTRYCPRCGKKLVTPETTP